MKKKPLIIAHRGASGNFPENTLAAFRAARESGADGIEFDVRLSKDGVPVVIHDADLLRTAANEKKIAEMTAAELAQIDVGSWFSAQFPALANDVFADEKIISLADFFREFADSEMIFYVEMKCEGSNESRIVEAVAAVIAASCMQSRVVVKSFEHDSLKFIKKFLPEIRTAALFEPQTKLFLRPKKHIIAPSLAVRADEISIHYALAAEHILRKIRAGGLKTVIWTANEANWVRYARQHAIDVVITNFPAKLLAKRAKLDAKRGL